MRKERRKQRRNRNTHTHTHTHRHTQAHTGTHTHSGCGVSAACTGIFLLVWCAGACGVCVLCTGAAWVCKPGCVWCAWAETHSQAKDNTGGGGEGGREGGRGAEGQRGREAEGQRGRGAEGQRGSVCVWGVPLGGAVRGRDTESGQKQPTRMDVLLNIWVGLCFSELISSIDQDHSHET